MAKLIAYAPGGGKATLTAIDQTIGGGATNLSQAEYEAYQRARLLGLPANGGDLGTAKALLEAAGWEVLWDGPPPRTQDDTLTFRLPADLKLWVQTHGGADLLRRLIAQERNRQNS